MQRRSFVSLVTKTGLSAFAFALSSCSRNEKEDVQSLLDIYDHARRLDDIYPDSSSPYRILNDCRSAFSAFCLERFENDGKFDIDGQSSSSEVNRIFEKYNANTSGYSIVGNRLQPMFSSMKEIAGSDTPFAVGMRQKIIRNRYNYSLDKLIEEYMQEQGYGDLRKWYNEKNNSTSR